MNGPIPAAAGDAELDHDDFDANAPEYYAADQAAMVEADRLQDEDLDPAAEPAGPYEHTGAYVGSELFDTLDTALDFCPDCEHAPCVAGALAYCRNPPRFIVAAVIVREIRNADLRWSPWQLPALLAMSELLQVASCVGGWRAQSAMATLADIRVYVRDELAKDES